MGMYRKSGMITAGLTNLWAAMAALPLISGFKERENGWKTGFLPSETPKKPEFFFPRKTKGEKNPRRIDPKILLSEARKEARNPENRASRRTKGRKDRLKRQRERSYSAWLRPKDLEKTRQTFATDLDLRRTHRNEQEFIEEYIYAMRSVRWPTDRKGRFVFKPEPRREPVRPVVV